jgi:uncharacterized protein
MYLTKRIKIFKVGPRKYFVSNALTGEIVLMKEAGIRIFESLRKGDATSCSGSVLKDLRNRKFVFPSKQKEEEVFRNLILSTWNEYQKNVPPEFYFVVNTQCNFNCVYCFEPEDIRAKKSTLSKEQVDAAFRVMDRLTAEREWKNPPCINIFGGEPLLPSSRPILVYIMRRISERGYPTDFVTNGYFLSDFIDFFAEYRESIRSIQVTLDGSQTVHDQRRILKGGKGTFEKIVSGINDLLKKDLPINLTLRSSFDRHNIDSLETMKDIFDEHGWTGNSRITFAAVPIHDRSEFTNLENLIGQHELLESVFPISKDQGDGLFDISIFTVLIHFRDYFCAAVKKDYQQAHFTPRVSFCGGAALKIFLFHPDGRIYPCPGSPGIESSAIGTYYPKYALELIFRTWKIKFQDLTTHRQKST